MKNLMRVISSMTASVGHVVFFMLFNGTLEDVHPTQIEFVFLGVAFVAFIYYIYLIDTIGWIRKILVALFAPLFALILSTFVFMFMLWIMSEYEYDFLQMFFLEYLFTSSVFIYMLFLTAFAYMIGKKEETPKSNLEDGKTVEAS